MNASVSTALKRLNSILPLAAGLESLNNSSAELYCKILSSYVAQGCAPTRQQIEEQFENAKQKLINITEQKLIVLDADDNPVGAYPFTSEKREHKVHINSITAYCMCALDALAVSPMFKQATTIDSQCRVTGEKVYLEQNGTKFTSGTVNAWFGINWAAATTGGVCAASLCMEMIFLANTSVARNWLAESPDTREIFDLPSAVDFAAGFFVPLAEQCKLRM